jgi:hypothetical protein
MLMLMFVVIVNQQSLFHPFDMLRELLGDKLYRKMCFGCFFILFIAACVFMAPMVGIMTALTLHLLYHH